jgi:hypothetical protein
MKGEDPDGDADGDADGLAGAILQRGGARGGDARGGAHVSGDQLDSEDEFVSGGESAEEEDHTIRYNREGQLITASALPAVADGDGAGIGADDEGEGDESGDDDDDDDDTYDNNDARPQNPTFITGECSGRFFTISKRSGAGGGAHRLMRGGVMHRSLHQREQRPPQPGGGLGRAGVAGGGLCGRARPEAAPREGAGRGERRCPSRRGRRRAAAAAVLCSRHGRGGAGGGEGGAAVRVRVPDDGGGVGGPDARPAGGFAGGGATARARVPSPVAGGGG